MSSAYQKLVYIRLVQKFNGWILMGIKNISQKFTNQLFFITHLMSWRGITSSGLDILSDFGYLMSSRTYFNHCKKNTIQYDYQIKKIITSDIPKIFWIDNFNKKQKHSLKMKTTVSMLNWTGIGISLPEIDHEEMKFSGLPSRILERPFIEQLFNDLKPVFENNELEYFSCYTKSIVLSSINSSNLKPIECNEVISQSEIDNMLLTKSGII